MNSGRALFLESFFSFLFFLLLKNTNHYFVNYPKALGMRVENVSNFKWFLDLTDRGSRRFKLLVWF